MAKGKRVYAVELIGGPLDGLKLKVIGRPPELKFAKGSPHPIAVDNMIAHGLKLVRLYYALKSVRSKKGGLLYEFDREG